MATFATDINLKEYEPDILKWGIQDFSDLHSKTYEDIIRLLNIKWWPTANISDGDITIVNNSSTKLTNSKLDSTQFVRLACYKVFADYIYPRLSSFDPDGDAFQNKMNYYKEKASEELDLILREGVHYDSDSSGTFEESEKRPFYHGRLIR
jgi:hypothetical protein